MSGGTLDTLCNFRISSTGPLPSSARLSKRLRLSFHYVMSVHNPRSKLLVWALPISLAATLGIEVSFFSYGYLDVSVPRVALVQLWIHCTITAHYCNCVPAFGYPWVYGCLLLTMAFRSLPRPSSAPIAKAFTLCSKSLNHYLLFGSRSLIFFR